MEKKKGKKRVKQTRTRGIHKKKIEPNRLKKNSGKKQKKLKKIALNFHRLQRKKISIRRGLAILKANIFEVKLQSDEKQRLILALMNS